MHCVLSLLALLLILHGGAFAQPQGRPDGRAVYNVQCAPCHSTGILNSPRTGDSAAWAPRIAAGINALYATAINGKAGMPPRGGNATLSDAQVMAAVDLMVNLSSANAVKTPAVAADAGKSSVASTDTARGRTVYQASCAACHATGAAGAPKLGDNAAWAPRLSVGAAALQASVLKGKGAMPPKGGNVALADADVRAAVDFMLAQARPGAVAPVTAAVPMASSAPVVTDAGKTTAAPASATQGRTVYQTSCAACHATGAAGAPKLGDSAAWTPRLTTGVGVLLANALKGKGAMPPKGGNASLADTDVRAAVDFMLSQARGAAVSAAPASAAVPSITATAPPTASAAVAPAPTVPVAVAPGPAAQAANDPNAFNRLMAPVGKRNAAPAEDGIHDPASPGTMLLQAPLASFTTLPRGTTGNYVDWVGALGKKQIQPRWDARDPKADATVMDLNIIREVKGSMPDVVFPHKQHTEWLDCSNCHPAIFVPQKGANQISMAAIMLGQKCGVCHGKVAFPVSECRLCHSRSKTAQTAGEAKR